MKLLGISRTAIYSPNMSDADAAIFEAVTNELRKKGHDVDTLTEENFVASFSHCPQMVQAECVFGMYRQPATLQLLDRLNAEYAIPSVNSAQGVRNADRLTMSQLFMRCGIPMPNTTFIEDCAHSGITSFRFPCWLKRGEGCAQAREDVIYVEDSHQVEEALSLFRKRGINGPVVASEHLSGDLVKFYGVAGTSFFYWYYASQGHSKFGLEAINGKEHGYQFSPSELAQIATRAASVLQLDVYGGDAVVSNDGQIRIIDFNDWPSFSPCRSRAAEAIAAIVGTKLINNR